MVMKLAEICEAIEVFYSLDKSRTPKGSTKQAYRINIRRRDDTVKLLKALLPYLVVKKAEAELAISWYETHGEQRGRLKTNRATNEDKVIFFEKLRSLKKTA